MICSVPELVILDLDLRGSVGLTSGCFDLIHYYHLHFLERAAAQCDYLIVGVDADSLIQANKGKTPVIPEFHRTAMVAGLRCVFAAFTMRSTLDLATLAPRAHKFFRNAMEVYGKPVTPLAETQLVILPDVDEATSTTSIIAKIQRATTETP